MKKELPKFGSIEEMARFWDEHETTDYKLEGPSEVTYEPKSVILSVRFEPEDALALTRMARHLGMDRSSLIRFLVKGQLRAHKDEAATSMP